MNQKLQTRVLLVVVVLIALGLTLYLQHLKKGQAETAKEAIQQVLEAQAGSWNKGNLEAFMSGYWNSPDMTFFSGNEVESGWQAALKRYQRRYHSEGREMGKLAFSDLNIVLFGHDDAFVRGRWHLVTSKEQMGGLFTLILARTQDGWRIIHDHTSAGAPVPLLLPNAVGKSTEP
jgi:beta-aspartyl-peptidase (threonine type)